MANFNGTSGNDRLHGTNGNDVLRGGDGHDILFGGAGDDVLDDLLEGAPQGSPSGNDLMFGGDGNDRLGGRGGDDREFGGDGDDTLRGATGNDLLDGGAGNDILIAGEDNDIMIGGDGNDTADFWQSGNAATDFVTVDLRSSGPQKVGAEFGTETLVGIENLVGTNITKISGGGDTLVGDNNANVLTGKDGEDILTGNGGADTFDYDAISEGGDTIIDFSGVSGGELDRISLSTIDADTTIAGNQVFSWGGNNAPTAHGVWYEDNGIDTTIVKADVNGDAAADFEITLLGTGLNLTALDFVL